MAKDKTTTEKTIEIDATGLSLGRLASRVAKVLIGKDKPSFQRHIYSGSPVKVINASKVSITSKKLEEMYHTRFSGYPSGLKILKGSYTVKTKGYKELVRLAIVGMLPKNKLKKQMVKNLVVEE